MAGSITQVDIRGNHMRMIDGLLSLEIYVGELSVRTSGRGGTTWSVSTAPGAQVAETVLRDALKKL
jgi:hypothetical protein